jgi:hypothetical protein
MSDTQSVGMPDPLLATLVSVLDVVVLERLHGGAFRQVGNHPCPSWFVETFQDVDPRAPVTLLQAFPVLDSFLTEAEIFWERTGYGRLEGEAVVVAGPGGRNLPLATIAVAMEGRHFLLLQRVAGFDDRQHILQRAREQALAHEVIVKRIDALRRPLEKLTALAGELAAQFRKSWRSCQNSRPAHHRDGVERSAAVRVCRHTTAPRTHMKMMSTSVGLRCLGSPISMRQLRAIV